MLMRPWHIIEAAFDAESSSFADSSIASPYIRTMLADMMVLVGPECGKTQIWNGVDLGCETTTLRRGTGTLAVAVPPEALLQMAET